MRSDRKAVAGIARSVDNAPTVSEQAGRPRRACGRPVDTQAAGPPNTATMGVCRSSPTGAVDRGD
eukprot:12548961-Prorocentrum_lima.AAC.1